MSTLPFNANAHKVEIQNVQDAQSALDSAIKNDLSNVLTNIKNLQADFQARMNILIGLPGFPESLTNDVNNIAATYKGLDTALPNYVNINSARQTFGNSVNNLINDLLPPAPPAPVPDSSSGLSGGAIVGIVLGSLVGLALIGTVIYFIYKHKKNTEPYRQAIELETPKTSSLYYQQHRMKDNFQFKSKRK